MKTRILDGSSPQSICEAAELIKSGDIVAMPTETVYGLAADVFCESAVKHIFEVKGRAQDNPLISHIADLETLSRLVRAVPEVLYDLAERFWPGPLTVIMPKSPEVPLCVTAGLDSVAVRMPSHPTARELIRACGTPLAAPSANLSGRPSPTTAQHVFADLDGKIGLILDGGTCEKGVESTVITLAGDVPRLLRPGSITPHMLKELLPDLVVDSAVLNPLRQGEKPQSPGMKYKHYSPKARVIILKGSFDGFSKYVKSHSGDGTGALVFRGEGAALSVPSVEYGSEDDAASLSNGLFSALRSVDEAGITTCYARCPKESDETLAVLNRLLRSAGFNVVEVQP